MRIAALAAILAVAVAAPALAQQAPEPVPIEEWSLEKVSAMGAEIYRHDVAAWVATDALVEYLAGAPPAAGGAGWIVVEHGDDLRVRFVLHQDESFISAFDVVVRDGEAGPVEVPVDPTLTAAEIAMVRARITAFQNIGRLRCSRNLNSVVLDDPDSDGWLVWLLTSTTDADVVPMGGHYRFRISADGSTVLRRDMLSNSCLPMQKAPPERGGQVAGLMVSQIVSRGPVETHVFLSLQNRLPIYVAAGDRIFSVEGTQIGNVER